jgi:regulator of sigma D
MKNLNGYFHKENLMNFCRNLVDIISEFHKNIAENLTTLFVEENKNRKNE